MHLRWAPSLPCAEAPRPAALAPEGPGSPGREEGGMWGGPGRTLLPGGLCPCCLIRTQIWCPCSSDPPYPHPGHGLERGDSPAAFQKPLELSCVDRWLPARAQAAQQSHTMWSCPESPALWGDVGPGGGVADPQGTRGTRLPQTQAGGPAGPAAFRGTHCAAPPWTRLEQVRLIKLRP